MRDHAGNPINLEVIHVRGNSLNFYARELLLILFSPAELEANRKGLAVQGVKKIDQLDQRRIDLIRSN